MFLKQGNQFSYLLFVHVFSLSFPLAVEKHQHPLSSGRGLFEGLAFGVRIASFSLSSQAQCLHQSILTQNHRLSEECSDASLSIFYPWDAGLALILHLYIEK